MWLKASLIGSILMLGTIGASADSWLPAGPLMSSSPSTELIVRIEPGTVDTSAEATYFRRTETPEKYVAYQRVALRNASRPMEAHIDDHGNLVTIDEYGRPGYENALVIYDVGGKEVVAYDLEEIYSEFATEQMGRTVTIRGWRHPHDTPHFDGGTFRILDSFGGVLIFDVKNGSISVFDADPNMFRPDPRIHIRSQ